MKHLAMFHFQSLRVGSRVALRKQGFMVLRKGPTGMSAGVPSGQVTRDMSHVKTQVPVLRKSGFISHHEENL